MEDCRNQGAILAVGLVCILIFGVALVVCYVYKKRFRGELKIQRLNGGVRCIKSDNIPLDTIVIDEQRSEVQAERVQRLEIKVAELEDDKEHTEHWNAREKDRLNAKVDTLSEERERLRDQLKDSSTITIRLEQEVSDLRKEKDNLLYRLSEQASSMMRNNNPNIVDLSDENRPTKLGERFSELYDNEWTEAYDVLEETSDDGNDDDEKRRETDILLDIIMSAYTVCKEKQAQLYNIFTATEIEVPADLQVKIKEQWKTQAMAVVDRLKQDHMSVVLATVPDVHKEESHVTAYASLCIELCWLMCVQDPPMVLEVEEEGTLFEGNRVRAYTRSGPTVSHTIWPALRLHEDGPFVGKGVAQCFKRESAEETLF